MTLRKLMILYNDYKEFHGYKSQKTTTIDDLIPF